MNTQLLRRSVLVSFFLLLLVTAGYAQNVTFDFETAVTGFNTKTLTQVKGGYTLSVVAVSENFQQASVFGGAYVIAGTESLATGFDVGAETSVTFSISGGYTFDLTSMRIIDAGDAGERLVFTSSKGSYIATINAGTGQVAQTITPASANLNGISSFTVTGSNFSSFDNFLYLIFDQVQISNITSGDSTPPTVTGVSSSTANGTYKTGDVIAVQVNFSENVTVAGGTPQLTLETGTTDRVVNYASGTGTSTLTFNYTIQAGDVSADLDYVSTSAMALNGSTIRDAAGNNATLTLASPGAANSLGANKALVIDGVVPTVTGVSSSTANGTYKVGDVIAIQVNFSENVTVTGGTPQLTLETGTTDRVVNYASGTGTSTLTFNYTIQAGDVSADLDYTGTSALALNGSTIRDAAGNNATLTLASPGAANSLGANKALLIDGVVPTVTGVSSSTANGTYKVGDVIAIQVNFSENVTVVGGTPQLTLETGTTDRVVNYASGTGTSTLTFNYTIQAGDVSADLDYISTSALALNGSTIRDAAGNDATLTLASPGAANSLGANKALVIDGVVPTVTGVSSSTANGTYKVGDVIAVQVNFSENVTVAGGTPQLTLETGTTDRVINYASGTGTSTLTFNYTVQAGDVSADLDYTGTSALALNGSTIRDAAGNNATLTLASPGAANSLGANKALVIDGVVPTVTGVSSSTANGTYKVGDMIAIQVNFSENVTVVGGPPQLTLETGTTDRTVNYASGTGTSTLTFNYTIQAGDNSADLDYTGTSALALNGSTIRDAAGNDATLTLASPGAANSLGANKNIVVDGVVPTVTGVSSSTANGTYKVGDVIAVQVNFSENVTVAGGTPQLTLETGTTDRVVNYASGTGTSTLTFNYTVQAGDVSADLDYTGTSALALNGSTILDATGNSATLTLATPGAANSLGANKALVVDGVVPTVTGVSSSTANGSYKVGDVIAIQVNFSENVTVTGTPQLTLETGTTDRIVNYVSGSGTSSLTFNYTVQSGDVSADLDYASTNALALNGGSIADGAGNNATLTLASPGAANSLGANKALVIDGVVPTVTGVTSSTTNGTYKVGDVIAVQVNFSENVTVTGTPQLTLETGTTDRVVNYASGSGTSALTFNYTVQSGDTSADLDYASTGALALNGGNIADGAGNSATLTLAAPGAANSLGANKALVVDGIVPTVTGVSSSTANGTYKIGDVIAVQVNFSENVSVIGTPQISLETGTTDRVVNYASGTGTSALTFNYTVQAGDTSADLDYTGTSALALNGSTITDATGNNATLTLPAPGATNSLGANKALVIDGVVATVTGVTASTANGSYKVGDVISIQVAFSKNVTVTGTPQLSLETGTTDRIVNYASGTSTTTLTFTYTVQAGDTSADLDYTGTGALALNGGTIIDDAANNAVLTLSAPGAAGSLGTNKALVIDGVAPVVSNVTSSTANGNYKSGDMISIQVAFSEAVTVTGTPQLTLETGTTDRLVNYTSGSGTATLTFTYTVQAGDESADLDYTATNALALNSGSIADAVGNSAVLTLAAPGAANSLSANKAIRIDTGMPAVSSLNSSATNSTYMAGEIIAIQVNFSENVTVTGTPQLILETGTTDRIASYASGSGSSTLVFNYTIQVGDESADLDALSTTALALNGGTITDAAGNAAVLTLPAPGAAGSLGANKALVIDGIAPTVSISSVTASLTNANPISITITFSEVMSGFNAADLAVTNGTASNMATSDQKVFTADITPTADGAITVNIAANAAADPAGNGNTAAAAFNRTYDGTAPGVPVIQSPADGTSITTTATPAVSGTAEANSTVTVQVDGSTAGTTTANGSGNWNFTTAALANGAHTVSARATDAAGNTGTYSANTNFTINTSSTITAGAISGPISAVYGSVSGSVQFSLSGINLAEAVTVTAPAGFAVSLDNTTFSTSVQAGSAGTLAATPIYVRSLAALAAGNHSVNITASSSGAATQQVAVSAVIQQRALTVSANAANKVYDGTTAATASLTDNRVSGDVLAVVSTSATFDTKNAGTGKTVTVSGISISGAAAANYTINTTATSTANITPYPLSITASASDKVYDGNTSAAVSFADNRVSGDVLTVTSTAATFDTKNAGTGKTVTVSGISINGASAANYTANTTATAGAAITPKALTATAAASNKVYDGTTAATVTMSDNRVSGDVLTIATTSANFDTKNTGTGKTVTVSGISISGAHAANYTVNSSASTTASITSKALLITAEDKTRFMGQPNPAFTATYSGFVTGEDASVLSTQPQFSTTATLASPSGDYPIVVTGAAAQNYSVTYLNGTLRVGQGAPTAISLATATLLENQATGTLAGTLGSTSPDPSATHTYTLVSGTGSADNASFSISGNQLLTSAGLNYENKSSYQVRVRSTNQYGLSLDQEFVVQLTDVNEAPALTAIANQAFCFDTNTRSLNLTGITAGPETGQTMSLAVSSNNASLFSQLSVGPVSGGTAVLTYRMNGPGTARVTLTVTDNGGTANGGVDTFSQSFELTANNQTAATISSDLGLSISKGATAILTASGGTTYQWAAAAGIIGGVNGAALTVRPTQATTYQVTVTNAAGCTGTASVTITVLEDYKVEANNYMSPDGDGVNDNLVIKNLDMYPNNEVKIYDRAGRMLYSKKNYTNDWNGTFQGAPLASDTYYYIVDFGPGRPPIKGFVTITRPQ